MKMKKQGIKFKLGISILSVTVIFSVSLTILFMNLTGSIEKRTKDSYQSMLELFTSQLYSGFEEIDNFVITLSSDFDVNMLAMQSPQSDKYHLLLYAVRYNIFSYYFNYRILNSFYIYDSQTDGVVYIPDDKGHYKGLIKDGIGAMAEKNGWYQFLSENGTDTIFVRAYRFGETLWLFAIVNVRNIAEEFEEIAEENQLLWSIEDGSGNLIYGSDEILANPQICDDYDVITEATNYNAAALYMNFYLGDNIFRQQYRGYIIFMVAAFGIFMALVTSFVLYTRKKMLEPLSHLLQGMEKFAGGDDQVYIEQTKDGEPEMQYALQSFNHMVEQLRENKFKIYESELERQKLLVQNMQSQINPHFFSNTTNLIYNLIEIGNIETAERCLLLLSDYYRYMTTIGDDYTTIKEEMAFVSSYMDIMKLRFPRRLSWELELEECLEVLAVPPLLIQPLVENCIKHGFTDRRKSFHVTVRIYVQADAAVIDVTDNGSGFPEENKGCFDIQHPMPEMARDEKNHIGLLNIYRRLMMTYEHNASMTIGDAEGKTLVRIRIDHWKDYAYDKNEH